jgi:MoxR-like ATPase
MDTIKQPDVSLQEAFALVEKAKRQIESVVIGKPQAIRLAIVAFLAKGHVLLEDLPGTGKTTLAKTIAATLGLSLSGFSSPPT